MEVTMSEPRELASEQNHTSSDGPDTAGPEMNTLMTRIADTLSTIQQQQPLPFPPLPPLPPSSSTAPLPALPPLPSLPNFDPSALLNHLVASPGGNLDSLLDSLTKAHSTSPLLSSTTAPPAAAAPPPSTTEPPLSLSLSPTQSHSALSGTSSAEPAQMPGMGVGSPVLLPAGLDGFITTPPGVDPLATSDPPAVALACTVTTGHSAPALPPAMLTDTIFTHDNSAPVVETLTRLPPASVAADTMPPVTLYTPLPLPPAGTRGALAINGVPAVMATVVARSVDSNAPLPFLPPPVLPPAVALQASALPQTTTGSTLLTPVTSSQAPPTQHPLPTPTAPPAFTATPLTTSHTPLSTGPLPTPQAEDCPLTAVQPAPTASALPDVLPPSDTVTHSEKHSFTNKSKVPASATNELICQGPPLNLQNTINALIGQGPPPTDIKLITQGTPHNLQTSTTNDLIAQGRPLSVSTTSTDEVMTQGPPPSLQTPTTNDLIAEGHPPSLQTSTTDDPMTQGPPPSLQATSVNEMITQGPPPSLQATSVNELMAQGPLHQPSPPSLHANEELLSEDSDEVEMEATTLPLGPIPAASLPPSTARSRSDSASPYTDDASFASFVAGEAHDSGSVMDEDHFSPSPSPLPSVSQSIDALVTQLHSQPTSSSSQLAMQAQFGVTAFCPRNPILPPPRAPPAPLDMSVHNFPKRSKYAHRAAMCALHPYHRTRGGGVNVAKTLDLLKAVLQSSFNMEVKRLCDDYLSLYRQAAGNIRENTGDTVPEATLRLLVNKMLEEAQHGYQKGEWEFPSGKLPRNEKVALAKASPMVNKKVKGEKGEARYGPPKRSRRPPAEHHSSEKTSWKWSMDKKRVDPGKWQPDTLSTETSFVLGVNVNKALGHGANRGKVYYLHPELFKYACDGDDKTWLYENKFLPVHGGKAFLMILTEVKFLVTNDDCYKDNEDILDAVKKLQEFQVPQFMLDKMKTFMRSVQGYFAQEASVHSSNSHEVTDTSHQKS